MNDPESLIVIAMLAFIPGLIVLIVVLAWRYEKKRRQELAELAERQGLRYEKDDTGQRGPYGQFKLFDRGRSRRSSNHLVGDGDDLELLVCDYRYTTGSGKNSTTHNQTICIVAHQRAQLPSCLLRRQLAFFDAIGKWFGGQDIDFDDDEAFSKRFVLQGEDEEQVRAAFSHGVRAWCLQQDASLQVECAGPAIMVHFGRRLKPAEIPDLVRTASTLMGHWLRPPWLQPESAAPEPAAPEPVAESEEPASGD